MIERIIEDWLTNANEKLFQYPFCQILSQKGHTVLHLTRHCAMEQGKDILSIDPNGNICTYQLKSLDAERMTLSKWHEILPQIVSLTYQSPIHPSIPINSQHKPFLVVNSNLDEEVQSAINSFNANLEANKHPHRLQVITKGEILRDLKNIGSDFWPIKPHDLNSFLELYLQDGKGFPDKAKLSEFLLSNFQNAVANGKNITTNQSTRLMLSTAILNSFLSTPFTKLDNYSAEFEGFVVYLGTLLYFIETNNIKEEAWLDIFSLSLKHLYNLLENLCAELSAMEYYHSSYKIDGECLTYRPRMTYLLSLMCLFSLWNRLSNDDFINRKYDSFIKDFIKNNQQHLQLWGEYASPQFLLYYLYNRITYAEAKEDHILLAIINAIVMANNNPNMHFTDPYTDFNDRAKSLLDEQEKRDKDSISLESYSIETFIHLLASQNYKNELRLLYPSVSRIHQNKFVFKNILEFYLWRAKTGSTQIKIPPLQQSWKKLRVLSKNISGNEIPSVIKKFPLFYLCFIVVFPHRLTSGGAIWALSELRNMRNNAT